MRELRKSNDRKLMGVAAGFAEYFEMDKSLWRAIWAIGCIVMPPLLLAYLILGIVLPSAPYGAQPAPGQHYTPPPPQEPAGGPQGQSYEQGYTGPQDQPRSVKRMTKSRDRWLSGVAGGMAEYLDLDPVLVRILFLLSLFIGGTGLLIYVVLAIIMPGPD
ncbi:MAG: PspC domain-containing protein, partial [Bacillota bacterium]